MTVAANGRHALSLWKVRQRFEKFSLLDVDIKTGRTHQIRVHLAAVDLPVAGDPVYGVAGDLGLARQFLHAARLAFPHPFDGREVEVSSPLPAELEAALDIARKGEAGVSRRR